MTSITQPSADQNQLGELYELSIFAEALKNEDQLRTAEINNILQVITGTRAEILEGETGPEIIATILEVRERLAGLEAAPWSAGRHESFREEVEGDKVTLAKRQFLGLCNDLALRRDRWTTQQFLKDREFMQARANFIHKAGIHAYYEVMDNFFSSPLKGLFNILPN